MWVRLTLLEASSPSSLQAVVASAQGLPAPAKVRRLRDGLTDAQAILREGRRLGIELLHVHHLSSTMVYGDEQMTSVQQIRYTPYGEARGHYNATGLTSKYELTGYESDPTSGLSYAGARFYDPTMATFLTHDPAGQFANPYAYGPGDPINGRDPTGTIFWLGWAVALFAMGVGVSYVQARANGASGKEALYAGVQAAVIGGISAVGMGIVGGMVAAATAETQLAFGAAMTTYGAYTTAQSFRTGQFVVGALGAMLTAFGAASLVRGIVGLRARAQGAHGTGTDSFGNVSGTLGAPDTSTGGVPYQVDGTRVATIYGGDGAEQGRIATALDRTFSADNGELLAAASKDPFNVQVEPGLRGSYRVGNTIYFGTKGAPVFYQSVATERYFFGLLERNTYLPVSPERVFAHELGHIYGPTGLPAMGVVDVYENPIMRRLGEIDRACYPCTR